jgi:light-regulated signal transduction histidine kinase (bacteriophytochrome)
MVRKDGAMIHVEAYGAVSEFNGRPAILGTLLDVTERVRSDEEIRSLNADLERRVQERTRELALANKELESFSYSVSHDLRAPLRHMGGFLELLQKKAGPVLDEKCRRYTKMIAESVTEMGNLIDNLLSFSRMARAELRASSVNIEELLGSVINELAPDCSGRDVRWQIGPLPVIQADPALLRQVFLNLLSNALKYTRNRSSAIIEIGTIPSVDAEDILFVRDNGVGFDMKYANKLFGIFQRLHRNEDFEGIGIGLANVQRIVNRHGGRIWADAVVDSGATFYFSLSKSSVTL